MRNTIKYSKYRSSKFMMNKICSVTLSMLTLLIVGAIVGTPLVIDAGSNTEVAVGIEDIKEDVSVTKNETVKTTVGAIENNAGVSNAIADTVLSSEELIENKKIALSGDTTPVALEAGEAKKELELPKEKKEPNVIKIRCTGYDDVGYTKSGEWTREGVIAGKEEWLHKKCKLYRINEDGSVGELIGEYTFLDTGYGIKTKTANGVEGSLKLGKSIDVWHPSEASIWEWMDEYGDYVYMEGPY